MRYTLARRMLVTLCTAIALTAAPSATQDEPAEALTYHVAPRPAGPLARRFTPHQLGLLEKLNRADLDHLPSLAVLVVPDRWPEDELAYSPLPRWYPSAAALPKALVVHVPAQAFGAYEHGQLVRWGPVSTGRRTSPTPAGLFALNWKSTGRHSTVNPEWFMPWYFNFEDRDGLAFHMYSLPGAPASHGCIRLLGRDAVWLYGWGDARTVAAVGRVTTTGTPVLILGRYDHAAPPPWRAIERLGDALPLPDFPHKDD